MAIPRRTSATSASSELDARQPSRLFPRGTPTEPERLQSMVGASRQSDRVPTGLTFAHHEWTWIGSRAQCNYRWEVARLEAVDPAARRVHCGTEQRSQSVEYSATADAGRAAGLSILVDAGRQACDFHIGSLRPCPHLQTGSRSDPARAPGWGERGRRCSPVGPGWC